MVYLSLETPRTPATPAHVVVGTIIEEFKAVGYHLFTYAET